MSRAAILLPLVLPLLADLCAQGTPDVEGIITAGRKDNQVMAHLDHLSNGIGGRLTGSYALILAAEWAAKRFESFGLEGVQVLEAGTIPVGFDRGPWFGRMIEPDARSLKFSTNAWSAGTKGVQRGPAVLATDRDQLAGAWVLTAGGRRRGEGSNQLSVQELIEAGALGTIRSVGSERITTGGRWPQSMAELPARPRINMAGSDFDDISARLEAGEDVVLEFDIRNYFREGPFPFPNVVADIPGSEFPDQYVIIGAHLDSWDDGAGTVDNGTGTSTTIEAARILMDAGVRPRRTIRFMLFGGEEQGLHGSRSYVRANPDLMPKISAVLVHDLGSDYLSSIRVTEDLRADFERVLAPVMTLNREFPFELEIVDSLRKGSSDHDSFLEAGVPGFIWRQTGRANYSVGHTWQDTYEQAIAEYQEHSSIVIALAAYGLASLDHLISRKGVLR